MSRLSTPAFQYYHQHLKPVLAQWMMIFLRSKGCATLSPADTLTYLTLPMNVSQNLPAQHLNGSSNLSTRAAMGNSPVLSQTHVSTLTTT